MKRINSIDTSEDDIRSTTVVRDASEELVVVHSDNVVEELSPFEAADWSAELLAIDGSVEYEYYSEAEEIDAEPLAIAPRAFEAGAFVKWAGTFMSAHVVFGAAGVGGLIVAAQLFGLTGIAVMLPMIVALVCAGYYRVGSRLAETEHAEHAWKPALAGLIAPTLLAAVAGLGLAAGVALLFPLAAHAGANEGI